MAMRKVYSEIKGMKLKELPTYFKPMLSVGDDLFLPRRSSQRAPSSRAQATRRATRPSLIPSSLKTARVRCDHLGFTR
ncbi:hypothetical protein V6N13_139458 [Hibiscus sabdariffa]|uniref:Uncharacterized protein n=1 Tax=Hibiscus sabdariffa TaxID=183260 RepID=A0ABR2C835_9ROSI